MTSAQVVETSVTNNSSFQNYYHPHDHNIRTTICYNIFSSWSVHKQNKIPKNLRKDNGVLKAPWREHSTVPDAILIHNILKGKTNFLNSYNKW